MNFEIDTKRFQEDLKKIGDKLGESVKESFIKNELNKAGNYIVRTIKKTRLSGPRPSVLGVVTGRLRSSITAIGTKKTGDVYINKIGTNVKYGRVHEFGSSKKNIPARPFLSPVIESPFVQSVIVNKIAESIAKRLA